MRILKAHIRHVDQLSSLAVALWPSHSLEDMRCEFTELLNRSNTRIYVCAVQEQLIGFAQFSIRKDYVEGASCSPVAHLEGLYVIPEYRRKGVARALINMGEEWARGKNCLQMASDCELHNDTSIKLHIGEGFREVNRVICFLKEL